MSVQLQQTWRLLHAIFRNGFALPQKTGAIRIRTAPDYLRHPTHATRLREWFRRLQFGFHTKEEPATCIIVGKRFIRELQIGMQFRISQVHD